MLRLFSIQFRMDTYQTQLRTLSTMIDNLLPIETQIEQKLTTIEYMNNYQVINNYKFRHMFQLFCLGRTSRYSKIN
jgi:hypothetical protein